MPAQILDYSAGFLIAFAAQAALLRQVTEGGSWHLRISLARTAQWLRAMGRVRGGLAAPKPALDDCMTSTTAATQFKFLRIFDNPCRVLWPCRLLWPYRFLWF